MNISVIGNTDKRAVIYTLLKLLEANGDVCLISDNRHYKRLLDGNTAGYLNSIYIVIGDGGPEEMLESINIELDEFEFIICDNNIMDGTDLCIYVQGDGIDDEEELQLQLVESYETIKMGKGKNAIPYKVNMLSTVENIEYVKQLREIDKALSKRICTIMAPCLGMKLVDVMKVVSK